MTLTIVEALGSEIYKDCYQCVVFITWPGNITARVLKYIFFCLKYWQFPHLFGSSTCLHWLAVFWHRNSQLPQIWCLQKYLEKAGFTLLLTKWYKILIQVSSFSHHGDPTLLSYRGLISDTLCLLLRTVAMMVI